jgi:putative transposase
VQDIRVQDIRVQDIRAELPAYADLHSHLVQEVLVRLERALQPCFRRRAKAGKKPGYPRFQGRARYHSCTYKAFGNGARLANGFLVRSTIRRLVVRWSRPLEGPPRTVTLAEEAAGW